MYMLCTSRYLHHRIVNYRLSPGNKLSRGLECIDRFYVLSNKALYPSSGASFFMLFFFRIICCSSTSFHSTLNKRIDVRFSFLHAPVHPLLLKYLQCAYTGPQVSTRHVQHTNMLRCKACVQSLQRTAHFSPVCM